MKWTFAIQNYSYSKVKEMDEIKWSSAKEVKKGDTIAIYTGSPHSSIEFIFKAKTDIFEDKEIREEWNKPAVIVYKKIEIPNPITLNELKSNSILREWGAVKFNFRKSHFKMSDEEWEELKRLILEKNPELKIENPSEMSCRIMEKLFTEFKDTYLTRKEGKEHTQKYGLEREKVKKYFEILKNDKTAPYKLDDPLINHLLPIKEPATAPAAVGDIKAFGYKTKDLPNLTITVYELITKLLDTDDKKRQEQMIQKFKTSSYRKGFQSAMLTPVLYYLDPKYFFINKKTVTTFNFISKILGTDDKITGELTDYIDNNDKLKRLVEYLSDKIPKLTFELFDAFCHWMCTDKLGNYALDQEKFDKWLKINCPESETAKPLKNKFLKFLETNYNQEMRIALGELERGRNVIFYGPPGSGKTVLSKILSEKYREKDAYSLYTVHSGTDYYDLVCRIVPQVTDAGNLIYAKERRFLLDALLSGKVLILDEINRTQIDTALGIFFTYLEKEHRVDDARQIREILKREIDEEFDLDDLKTKLADFRVVGTLNVYDKTFLFKLGDALKRRFTFVEITTTPQLLNDLNVSPEFRKEFMDICKYEGDLESADKIINAFTSLNQIKPLGIGILKEALLFSSYFEDEAADLSISSIIVPFFENDLNFSTIKGILEKYDLKQSMRKLESLNFGTSDINGI